MLHKVVLSRILGRAKDLRLPVDFTAAETAGIERQKVKLTDLMDEQQQLDIMDGLSTVEDYAWMISERCWICERWSYYLPLVTKEEIEACQDDYPLQYSKLVKLKPSQERAFDTLI